MKKYLEANLTGCTKWPEYHVWRAMLDRCTNRNHISYDNYGGRGIAVCSRWYDFRNFIEDMKRRPTAAHELDRWPDNDGNYEPTNCRWATHSENALNRRDTFLVTFRGITKPLKVWAQEIGISRDGLRTRLRVWGDVERAMTEPVNIRRSKYARKVRPSRAKRWITYRGTTRSLSDWAKRSGNDSRVISRRIYLGWPLQKAIFSVTNRGPRSALHRAS